MANPPKRMIKNPVINPQLQQAMKAFREKNDPQNLNNVINALLRAVLVVPVALLPGSAPLPKPDAQGRIALPKDARISFTMLTDPQGQKYFMAFSDHAALRQWKQMPANQQTVLLRFDNFVKLLQENAQAAGFVVDPFSGNLRFTRQMVENIVKQREAIQRAQANGGIQPGDKVTLVEPTVLPDAMLDPVCGVLAGAPDITAAYLQILIRNDTERSYLLVLDGPADKDMMQKIAEAAKPFLISNPKKMNLSITTAASPLGRQGMQDSEPFYRKGEGRVIEEDDD